MRAQKERSLLVSDSHKNPLDLHETSSDSFMQEKRRTLGTESLQEQKKKCGGGDSKEMPNFANFSEEATKWLIAKTGSPHLECYTCIDPDDAANSFFLVRTTNKMIHVRFSEITYDPSSYESLLEGLYQAIYS
jgi:hypothetical protein